MPLRPGGRPGANWGGGFGRPGQHPGPLQRHGVVRRLPGRVWVGLGEVGDRDAHVAWWGGRRLPVAALLPGCCGREKALQSASREAHPGPHAHDQQCACGVIARRPAERDARAMWWEAGRLANWLFTGWVISGDTVTKQSKYL